METHRSLHSRPGGEPQSPVGSDRRRDGGAAPNGGRSGGRGRERGRDREPLDAAWLEGHALRYAARWETTRRGVAELLERKVRERCERTGESPEAVLARVPGIVEELVARRYVDDRRFATQLTERLRRQGRSRAQIQMQLRRKGVPDGLILEQLRERDGDGADAERDAELQAAWRLARRRRLGPHCPDPERRAALRERHLAALARQGFSREIAERVIDADGGQKGRQKGREKGDEENADKEVDRGCT